MYESFVIRGFSLAALALLVLAPPASAGSTQSDPPSGYEEGYSGPPIIRRIPGLRILFGDRTVDEDMGFPGEKKKKKKDPVDESYYEPQPAKPNVVKPPPAKPAAGTAAKPATVNPALPQKTASTTPAKPLAGGPLNCEAATSVVSGFGFSSVEAASCSGKIYAFNAKRGGKTFAIKLDPASGQLTEVKKLP